MKKIYTSYEKIPADTLTPVQVYLRIRDESVKPVLLESSEYQTKSNDYSYICFNPLSTIAFAAGICYVDGIRTDSSGDLKQTVQAYQQSFDTVQYNFPFVYQGLFGYTAYKAIPLYEHITFAKPDEGIPELYYALYQLVLVFDHYHDELYIFSHHTTEADASAHLQQIKDTLLHKPVSQYGFYTEDSEQEEIDAAEFKGMVSTAKQHCQRGDVFQIVLSRKFRQAFKGDEFNVYRALRRINPSPYLFYFDYGNFKLFGSSPESQVIVAGNEVITHPIAGTVRRTGDAAADRLAAESLIRNPKENAEHVMLVDLARNDVSKHAKGVHVSYYKQLHQYSHVIHMVSEVKGTLREGHHAYEVLLDTFPAGTLSGAPKFRAMQLIQDYEASGRSFYGGAIGMMDFRNQLFHAIIIRSFLSKNNVLQYQAGAGIVLASSEESELQEVDNKIDALRKAIQDAVVVDDRKLLNQMIDEKIISAG